MTYSQDQQTANWQPGDRTAPSDDQDVSTPADAVSDDAVSDDAVSDATVPVTTGPETTGPNPAVPTDGVDSARLDDPAADEPATSDSADDLDADQLDGDELGAGEPVLADEVIVAEVVDETPYQQSAAARTGTGSTANGSALQGVPQLSEEWHDIQADFVDDPSGAVQRAAQAADAAVDALTASLQEYRDSLGQSSDGDAAGTPDTEQLRTALRGYRIFCQNVEEIGRQLPLAQTATR